MQIEEGKFYRDRHGRKVGPIKKSETSVLFPSSVPFPFLANRDDGASLTFTHTGNWNADGEESSNDLVEECREQPVNTREPGEFGEGATVLTDTDWNPVPASTAFVGHRVRTPDTTSMTDPDYSVLAGILHEAHDQAASGKGKERHNGRGVPFDRQPIAEIGRMCGPGFNVGQSIKKQQEAMGMLKRGEADAAIRELLGSINYAASAIMLIREQ